jgi:hypothetical protein
MTDHLSGSHFEAVEQVQKVAADVLRMANWRIPKKILKYSPIRLRNIGRRNQHTLQEDGTVQALPNPWRWRWTF